MSVRLGRTLLRVEFSFWAALTLTALLEPSGLGLLGLFAALLHELGHFFACLLTGAPPKSLTLTAFGPRLEYAGAPRGDGAELLILLAGCAVNAGCAVLGLALSRFGAGWLWWSGCHLLYGAVNLLPAQGLDGGKAFLLFCRRQWGPEAGERGFCIFQFVFLSILTTICIYFIAAGRLHFSGGVLCAYLWLAALLPGRNL